MGEHSLVTQMVSQLTFECGFQGTPDDLLDQAVLAQQVLGVTFEIIEKFAGQGLLFLC